MKDLGREMAVVNRQLARSGLAEGGRLVMFISARRGEGVSSVASSAALEAAQHVQRPAWLIDLDVMGNRMFNAFAVGALARKWGGVGKPYSACLRETPFFSIRPTEPGAGINPSSFTAHQVGNTKLMVTQFDSSSLQPGQSLQVRSRPEYWDAVRESTDWTVVDAPALESSSAGLAVAGQMDNCVIVSKADETPPDEVENLRDQLEAHGARVSGVVLNRVRGDALFLDRVRRGLGG